MNENLNLVEILKDVQRGTMLWSPVFGDCTFINIDLTDIFYPIKCQITTTDRRTTYVGFTKDGRLDIQYENGGCVLFPSKENMDWSTFRITKEYKCFEFFQKNIDKGINSNGFDYVDLCLPSGTKWATMNVGASKPSDYGLYFQWGDVRGFTKGQIGRDKAFSWSTYKWSVDGIDSNFSKYNTADETLDLEDDAANIHMGGDWHMPTPTQIRELIHETDNTWTTQDGVNGRLFTSKNNGKSIFIPAAGYAWNGSLNFSGGEADVWSSTLKASNVNYGCHLSFDSYNVNLSNDYRYYGFSVRGVLDGSLGHKHFEPFQKVLIKEWLNSKSLWVPAVYTYYNAENNRHYIIGGKWAKNEHIIPYEGNEYKVGKSANNEVNCP